MRLFSLGASGLNHWHRITNLLSVLHDHVNLVHGHLVNSHVKYIDDVGMLEGP